jgi:hypothetical protein
MLALCACQLGAMFLSAGCEEIWEQVVAVGKKNRKEKNKEEEGLGMRIARAHPSHEPNARRMGHPQVFLLVEEKHKMAA